MSAPSPYSDARLAALYDALNPAGPDTDFYIALAQTAAHIVDLGCGTGLLACELAARGYRVTGIDPSPQMLAVARHRPNGERVTWIEGDAGALAFANRCDLIVMTGHVAQIFLDDAALLDVLKAARRALRIGGRIAFESRNPATRAWQKWTPEDSLRRVSAKDGGAVDVWQELHATPEPSTGRVAFTTFYRFGEGTGDTLHADSELRFRTQDELAALLMQAGFTQTDWYGNWDRAPVDEASRELIAVAR
jgi:SAM-dependent methyltransferase